MLHPDQAGRSKIFPWWGWLLVAAAVVSLFYLDSPIFGNGSGSEASSSQAGSGSTSNSSPGLGQTQETRDGIAITPSVVSYDVASPSSSLIGEPLGAYATVTFRVDNNGGEPHRLFIRQMTATIGGSEYNVSGITAQDGKYLGSLQNKNPGLSLEVVAYLDIPPGQTLETFNYESSRIGGSKVTFDLR